MGFGKGFKYMLKHLREKHRLSVQNQHTGDEVWYMHISPLNILSGFVALVMIIFIITITTVAYTSILDFIPGYPGNKSREMLITNIMRLDSLEQELKNLSIYSDNVALIMSGKSPVTRHEMKLTDSLSGRSAVGRSHEDSLLRLQMEAGSGPYSLSGDGGGAQRNLRGAVGYFAPVKGVVASEFSPKERAFGISVGTSANQQVMAVADGTVLSSSWSPDDGYTLYIQHANNTISVYRHNARLIKGAGDRVKGGEVIGYTGDGSVGAGGGKSLFEFEMWVDGVPVDPRSHIVF